MRIYSMVIIVNNILHIWKLPRVQILQVLITRENNFNYTLTEVNQTHCGDHFTIYTNIETYCAPETNIMLYVKNTSVKRQVNKQKKNKGRKGGRKGGRKRKLFIYVFGKGSKINVCMCIKKKKISQSGSLAGLVSRACVFWSGEFEPHLEGRVNLKKKKSRGTWVAQSVK